jgi:peptide-methionine (S)-S-oxide reductase
MRLRSLFPMLVLMGMTSSMACAATQGRLPQPKVDDSLAKVSGKATAVFAGGCFWGTQAVFERVKGVVKTTAGYAGGAASTATYDQVTTETTGHAESVEVVYDPTELNRQGPDVGTSYRSAIFFTSPDQQRIAEAYTSQLGGAKAFAKPIVTQIVPLKGFYAGEEYHQDYALKNPDNPYIMVCDRPKIATLKTDYPSYMWSTRGTRVSAVGDADFCGMTKGQVRAQIPYGNDN